MAHFGRCVLRQGAAFGRLPLAAAPANPELACRAMSTSSMAESAGSVLGRFSEKVKGDTPLDLAKAMEAIERREKLIRVPEALERRRHHEKGYEKTRRRKATQKWRAEFRTANQQLNWMKFLQDRGVPIPGQKIGKR